MDNCAISFIAKVIDKALSINYRPYFDTAFATMIGALCAFWIESWHRRRREKYRDFTAAKHAQFILISQYQTLLSLRRQHLDPVRLKATRHIEIRPTVYFADTPHLDISSLLFLLDGKYADLLNELNVSSSRVQNAMGIARMRSELHEDFQKRASSQGVDKALDVATDSGLKSLTDHLYESVDESIAHNEQLCRKLQSFIEEKYPKRWKALKFHLKDEEPRTKGSCGT